MASVKTALKFNTFESKWELFSEEERVVVVKDAAMFEPEIAIMPVLAGITSNNFYAAKKERSINGYSAVHRNSWGEMFCKSFSSNQGFPSMDEAKQDIMKKVGIKKIPLNTAFYFSKGAAR